MILISSAIFYPDISFLYAILYATSISQDETGIRTYSEEPSFYAASAAVMVSELQFSTSKRGPLLHSLISYFAKALYKST
jgi:hypothetical protein